MIIFRKWQDDAVIDGGILAVLIGEENPGRSCTAAGAMDDEASIAIYVIFGHQDRGLDECPFC